MAEWKNIQIVHGSVQKQRNLEKKEVICFFPKKKKEFKIHITHFSYSWYVNITEQVCVDLFDVIATHFEFSFVFREKKHQKEVYIYIIQL